jgi:hypothetical protein
MHHLIETYRKPFISELLDIAVIREMKMDDASWRHLLIKHGHIKQSTKIIRSRSFVEVQEYEWRRVKETGGMIRVRLDEPRISYRFRVYNGRNQFVLNETIKKEDIPQILEEL